MARQLNKLSQLRVKAIKEKGTYHDGGGLYLYVAASGAKSWRFFYMLNGKSREMGLGSFEAVTLAEARLKMAECKKLLAAKIDPINSRNDEQAKARLAAASRTTFKECANSYIEAHKDGWKNKKHIQQYNNTLKTYVFPIIGNLPIQDINVDLVMKVLEPIFGALLEMLAHGLKQLPHIKMEQQPRMADFALWATACETAAWPEGTFMAAFEANRAEANEDVIAASSLATAICDFLHKGRKEWEGTASDLLNELRHHVDEHITRDRKLWPQTNKSLSERLTRVAPALRRAGVEIERRKNNDRLIKLYRTPEGLKSAPAAPFAPGPSTKANKAGLSKTPATEAKQKAKKYTRRPPNK